ncbi:MAG: DUF459 domain-containing protein [Myxococcota bacterium]
MTRRPALVARSLVALALGLALAPAVHAAGPSRRKPTPYLSEPPHPNGKSVLMIGDSNFFGPLGHVLYRELVLRGYRVSLLGKPASGLAHPQFFNWFRVADGLVKQLKPDIVIALFGGNDGQPITRLDKDDPKRVPFADERDWDPVYEKRVRELATILHGDSREVFFLSPTNRKEPLRTRVVRIKGLQQQAMRDLPQVHPIDMFPFSTDDRGEYLRTGVDANGKTVVYRRPDGIHLTQQGGELVGRRLMDYLVTSFGI